MNLYFILAGVQTGHIFIWNIFFYECDKRLLTCIAEIFGYIYID